jgi:hypothetical protein
MKQFMTAIAICACVFVGNTAYAQTTWDGTADGAAQATGEMDWSYDDNWVGDTRPATNADIDLTDTTYESVSRFDSSANSSPYGDLSIGNNTTQMEFRVAKEAITFDSTLVMGDWTHAGTKNITAGPITLNPVASDFSATTTVSSGRTLTGSSLTIDADTAGYDRLFEKAGDGILDVTTANGGTGTTQVKGDPDGANPATLQLSAGTLSTVNLELLGGTAVDRQAILDFDGGTLTISGNMTMKSYVEIDAEASFCVQGNFSVEANGSAADAAADVNTGTISITGTFRIAGDASNAAQLAVTGGTIQTVSSCP